VSGNAARLKALENEETQRKLSKEELLRPRIVEKEEFIDGLGGTVTLRSLSHARRQEIRTKSGFQTSEWNEDLFTSLGIVYSVVDPKLTEEDIEKLREQDSSVYDELVLKITMLNMLGRADDLKKESSETQSSDSPSS